MPKNWYVLYVKPQSEIKVADRLSKNGIQVYCPVIEEIKIWSDRKKVVKVPLFKSYVFVCLPDKERQLVFDFPGIVRYLFWLGKPAIVRDEEIDAIKEWVAKDSVEEYKLSQLTPGDRVSINNNVLGVIGGKRAIVKEVGKNRVRLILEDVGLVINMKIKQVS
ncbi:UpxY family transcription antiterminator [Hyunsoonleella pacifica]|uniref:UpxY family transcription antiterminator n=1 Tax=Hyunsoonleella pacifica TaxID=1080224 RepID=A0A4Q9FRJ1_9FLAO|nr:UpxY family transcription antiterminator [Hyunsoonleella pacifica]TBN18634.1 UpxY family transcription antiterminator [Hyunsoonleella pacifica]GGD03429.1 transcriptional antiterminator [Hyunsoonleella pacifica]